MVSANREKILAPLLWAGLAVACFHLAYLGGWWSALMVGCLYALLRLADVDSLPGLIWLALLTGLALYAPPLFFFWNIFGWFAVSLWLVLCLWLVAFLVVAQACRRRFGLAGLAWAAPFLWTGLEFFRSECYYLRFTWLIPGYAFSTAPMLGFIAGAGVYGLGFCAMALAAGARIFPHRRRQAAALWVLTAALLGFSWRFAVPREAGFRVAGVQLESPSENRVLRELDKLEAQFPDTPLFVLSENTFSSPPPEMVKAWCRGHGKYLLVGGRAPAEGRQYYNTAFVVGPAGEIVFSQGKCVPVQFFDDGLPAPEQQVWNSPWGKIGIGICYDASYRRVVDELVRQGAEALIFPTMDEMSWGPKEHQLGSLVAPMRAAEHGLPLFRLASSGISQIVQPEGQVVASADYPGQGEQIAGFLVPASGRLPLDYYLAPLACVVTGAIILALFLSSLGRRRKP